jgi:hypothetical protein
MIKLPHKRRIARERLGSRKTHRVQSSPHTTSAAKRGNSCGIQVDCDEDGDGVHTRCSRQASAGDDYDILGATKGFLKFSDGVAHGFARPDIYAHDLTGP